MLINIILIPRGLFIFFHHSHPWSSLFSHYIVPNPNLNPTITSKQAPSYLESTISTNLIGLEFRPDKCASLSMTYNKRYNGNIQINNLHVQDKAIPALKEHEGYRYLGVPIDIIGDVDNLDSLVDDLCNDFNTISSSLLTPLQKLDAIRTLVQPYLTFALHTGKQQKASLTKYRKKLIKVVRSNPYHLCLKKSQWPLLSRPV